MGIKIFSGWTNQGGSTRAFIELTNLFNKNGYDCALYGPGDWHLGKCKSGKFDEAKFGPEDVVICHVIQPPENWRAARKLVLSCHETNLVRLNHEENEQGLKIDYRMFDFVHFVSCFQRDWHVMNHYPNVVIPNVVSDFAKKKAPTPGQDIVVVIIGSIDHHKRTHVAIEDALKDGYEDIRVFGIPTDKGYFDRKMAPYVNDERVSLMGHEDDQQVMYDQINVVYHRSKRETFNLVYAECKKQGLLYNGPIPEDVEVWNDEAILDAWVKALGL